MDLRTYLTVLRRHRWLIIEAVVIAALAAFAYAALKPPVYTATARVLLHPNDSSERITPSGEAPLDPDRYGAVQAELVTSPAVAGAAAATLGGGEGTALAGQVSVLSRGEFMDISATDAQPVRAREIANAFANAYIENRRLQAVLNLQRASDELGRRLDQLQGRINDLNRQVRPDAPPNDASGSALQAASDQYRVLYDRQQQLLIDMSLKRGSAELVAEATTPADRAGTPPLTTGLVGVLVGLALGLAAAFLREQLDDRMRTRDEVEAANGLPVLAEFPFDPESAKRPDHVAAAGEPRSPLAEAARGLRTSMTFLGFEKPLKRIAVASPSPGDGKTLVSANLAVAFAQAGYRTALVSADFRRPRLDRMFDGLEMPTELTGFTDLIVRRDGAGPPQATAVAEEKATVHRALSSTLVPNLLLLRSGALPPNPAELLASRHASDVLNDIAEAVDMVIVDTAPLVAVTDTVALADKVDGLVIVNSMGQTHRGAIRRARETLKATHVRLLGVVLNKVSGLSQDYYPYYAEPGTAAPSKARARKGRRKPPRHVRKAARAASRSKSAEARRSNGKASAAKAKAGSRARAGAGAARGEDRGRGRAGERAEERSRAGDAPDDGQQPEDAPGTTTGTPSV